MSATDLLIVTSKVKKYVKNKTGMSTSAAAIEELSKKVESMLDEAIQKATTEKRKTVMDRDVV